MNSAALAHAAAIDTDLDGRDVYSAHLHHPHYGMTRRTETIVTDSGALLDECVNCGEPIERDAHGGAWTHEDAGIRCSEWPHPPTAEVAEPTFYEGV